MNSDEEEEYILLPYPELKFTLSVPQEYKSSLLLISLSGAGSIFAHSLFPTQPPSNRINFSRLTQSAIADVYVHHDAIFIIFNEEPSPMNEYHFSKFLQANFHFSQCIILTNAFKQNTNYGSESCLYSLCTTKWAQKPMGAKYKDLIEGIAAEVLIYGEINGIPMECGIGVFEEYQLKSEEIEVTYGKIRGKYGLEYKGDMKENTKKYNRKRESKGIYV